MKKGTALILYILIFCLCISGCSYDPSNVTPMTEPDCEEMEVYKVFMAEIPDDATLDEMLDAFEKMCQVPMEVNTDMYLVEVFQSSYNGTDRVCLSVHRQFEIPGYYEFIDLGFTVEYILEDDIADFGITKFFEDDWKGFLDYIRNSDFYSLLLTKPILERHSGIGIW